MLGCICIRIWRGYDEKSIRVTRQMSNSFTWQYLLMASNLASATREILLLPKNIRSRQRKDQVYSELHIIVSSYTNCIAP